MRGPKLPWIYDKNKKDKTKPEGHSTSEDLGSFECICAKKLSTALTKAGFVTRTPKLSAWTKDFKDLLKYRSKDKITIILDWYCSHLGQPYLPKAYSAASFCEKFSSIEEQYKQDPSSVTISEEAKDVVQWELGEHDWPHHLVDQLPSIVQRCLDAYKPFYERLLTLKETVNKTHDNNSNERSMLNRAFDVNLFRDPRDFVRFVWIRTLYEMKAYKGNPKYLVWSIDSPMFKQMGQVVAKDWTGDPRRWDNLAKLWEGW